MLDIVVTVALWVCAIGTALMAGLYFSFSTFIMTALQRAGQASGVAAMNAINVEIVRSLFLPVFFGSTIVSAALAVAALFQLGETWAIETLAAGVIYVPGMFVCTMLFNVPLNNQLAAVDPVSAAAAPVWARYLKEWTAWNHLRTVSSTVALALYIAAIAAR